MILIQPPVVQNWNSLVNKPSILSDDQVSWGEIQNKPTTLTGYGITDGQPLGNELTALQSLADTPGFLKKTGNGTYSIDVGSYLSLAGGTITGALIATSFSGVGTALTALNASNISTGTINAARLPAAYLPLTGGTVTGTLRVADGVTSGNIHLGGTATTGYYSQVAQNSNNLDIIANGDQAFRVSVGTNNGTGNIRFFTANYALGNTERMQITATGNVGIGLVNPSTLLQVAGTTTTTDMIVSATTPSTSPTTGASRVTGGQGVQGNQYVGGFSSLGGDANHPGIKVKVLTGTTAATEGGVASIAHGLTVSKIVSVTVLVNHSENAFVLSGYSTQWVGLHFSVSLSIASIQIINHPTDSENILLKPVKITVIYTA
jgi:hypothetical protein